MTKHQPTYFLAYLPTLLVMLSIGTQEAVPATLDDAISRGVVNWRMSPSWPNGSQQELEQLASLKPGLIYKVGSRAGWGQVSQRDIDRAGTLADMLKRALPAVILGIGLGESIVPDLDVALQCEASPDVKARRFTAPQMVRPGRLLSGTVWLDMSSTVTRDFYECQGRILLRRGFNLLHFDGGGLVIKNSSSRSAAVENFKTLITNLTAYAESIAVHVYFSGDLDMTGAGVPLDAVYLPSRFFHVTIPAYRKYQNKITRDGIGVGYSYSISPSLVRDAISQAPGNVRILFYIDNWDASQDDLRRFMELDAENRRFLMVSSAAIAHDQKAYFIPSIRHCDGCIQPAVVGDRCELRPGGLVSEYDAFRCGDMQAIRKVLDIQSSRTAPF